MGSQKIQVQFNHSSKFEIPLNNYIMMKKLNDAFGMEWC